MVLDQATKKLICDFVYVKPRVVDEVAKHIGKNWRTADRYIQKISEEDGCISMRTFREGTRGALKIVFWSNIEKIHSHSFQEALFQQIVAGKTKYDFDPFDLYQYVDDEHKSAFAVYKSSEKYPDIEGLRNFIEATEEELLIFSGNLSLIDIPIEGGNMLDVLTDMVKRGIRIKVVCRVDYASTTNIENILRLNTMMGKDVVEIRHSRQPLRGFVRDRKVARLKDMKRADDYKTSELKHDLISFLEINDEEWASWLANVFHSIFRHSIDGNRRLVELKKIMPEGK